MVTPEKLREALSLPVSTGECEEGPIAKHRPGHVSLRYDAEDGKGVVWTQVGFAKVLAARFTPDPASAVWMVEAYSKVCEVEDSSWIDDLRSVAASRGTMLAASARHFAVYFDHIGCWEVLADEVRLEPSDT